MIGTVLGNRYKLLSELGHGGMAWVYLAQDLRREQLVAVKILYPQLGQDLDFLRRFAQEARLSMTLTRSAPDAHIARILDYGSEQDTHYLVMEYVPGRDLRRVLTEDGPLPWQQALDIARQIALALNHAHRHGIVHRDIKPENIMLLPDGSIRVLDFGLARARTSPSLTQSGFVGSPYYAAPEQVNGKKADIRADLYSLGVILYEMLTGSHPFPAETPWEAINKHLTASLPSPETTLPDLPPAVGQIIRRAMAKKPEERFQTPGEMVQALTAALAGQSFAAGDNRPRLSAHPTARPTRRRNLLWAAVGILLMALLVEIGLLYDSQQPPAIAAVPSQPTPTATRPLPTPTLQPGASPTANVTLAPSQTLTPSTTPRSSTTPSPRPTRTASPTCTCTPTPTATHTPSQTPPAAATATPPPDGWIAFPRFDPQRGTYDVYLCRVDGSTCRRVIAEASQPDFLPNGDRLVVHSWKADDKGLLLLSRNGQPIWKITDTIEAARPSADFRGESYVYHARAEQDRQPRLYRTAGTAILPIRRAGHPVLGTSPSWLPDGRILYSGCLGDDCGILVTQTDGSQAYQLAAGGSEANPEASPDGRQVAFMSRRDGNWEVYVINLDGSDLRRLTHNPANDGLPTWSPDGRFLAFVSDRTGQWAVWIIASDGGEPHKLFDIGGPLDGAVRGAAPHEIHGWVEERLSWGP